MSTTKIVRYREGTSSNACGTVLKAASYGALGLLAIACSGQAQTDVWDVPSGTTGTPVPDTPGAVTPGGVTPGGTVTPGGATGPTTPVPGATTVTPGSPTGETPVTPTVPPTNSQCAAEAKFPFRVLTRLNRAEYDNTVRDLLGDESHAALAQLPADAGEGAFDNNAAALTISPALVETYVALADEVATAAIAPASPGRALVLVCDPGGDASCIDEVITTLGTRAFRRPIAAEEVASLRGIYDEARALELSVDDSVTAVVKAVLLSPNFLFRPEVNSDPAATGQRAATPFELASRLSYYLWSSMPDDALMAAATNNQLSTPAEVQQQVARMLTSPKAEALYARFPGLWLQTLDIDHERPPAPAVYPTWNDQLADDMQAETAAFMRAFMTEDVDFLGFLDAKFTYLNQRLAQFYGIEGTFGEELTRTSLSGDQRGGILTQGAVLRVTSFSERTSPVVRGAWILARLLNSPPPPPPANLTIPALEEADGSAATPSTTREKLELHRADPTCAGCHAVMDPLGFGLDHYDGIGAWRTAENGVPINARGTLTNGTSIDGAIELSAALKADPRTSRSITSFLLSYSLGRVTGPDDSCRVAALETSFASSGHRMQTLLSQVASSDAFLTRTMSE